MRKLKEILVAGDDLLEDELILLRLLGRPFGRPIRLDMGEQPEDVFLTYLRESLGEIESKQNSVVGPFVQLIGKLMHPQSMTSSALEEPAALDTLISNLPDTSRPMLAFRLIRLLDSSGVSVGSKVLERLAEEFNPGPRLGGAYLSVYWQLVMSRFASHTIPDDRIPVCREMVLDDAFIDGPIIAAAAARPFLFFMLILPIIFDALRSGALKQSRVLESLEAAAKGGFISLYRSRHKARRTDQITLIAANLKVLATAGFVEASEAILKGAAEATRMFNFRAEKPAPRRAATYMPFKDFSIIEAGYSCGLYERSALTRDEQSRLDSLLGTYTSKVEELANEMVGGHADPVLATNLIPYSQAIYLLILKEVLSRAKITLELQHHPWGDVLGKLQSGRLSFAIWNGCYPDGSSLASVEVSKISLFEYNGYPLVIRRDCLEAIAIRLDGREQNLVIDVLRGKHTFNANTLSLYPGLLGELKKSKIASVKNSEIDQILQKIFGRIGRSMSSDQAVECLVDGALDAALLGGVQGHYLDKRFARSTVRLAMSKQCAPVSIWFKRKNFEELGYPRFVRPLQEAWQVTCKLWSDAMAAGRDDNRDLLRRWIRRLALSLNLGVGNEGGALRTPLTSWQDLAHLYARHDTFLPPGGSIPSAQERGGACDPSNIVKLGDAGARKTGVSSGPKPGGSRF